MSSWTAKILPVSYYLFEEFVTVSDQISISGITLPGETPVTSEILKWQGDPTWIDHCDDGVVNTSYWDWDGDVTEHDGFIDLEHDANNPSQLFYDKANYPVSGDYDNSFEVYVAPQDGNDLHVLFDKQVNMPVEKTWAELETYNRPFLFTQEDNSNWRLRLWNNGGYTVLASGLVIRQWYTIRIKRVSTTVTIYLNGEQKWSGTLTEPGGAHDNHQFHYPKMNYAKRSYIDEIKYWVPGWFQVYP